MDISIIDSKLDVEDLLGELGSRVQALEHGITDLLDMVFYTDTEYDLAVEAELDKLAAMIDYVTPE